MATKSDLSKELFNAAVNDGRVVQVICKCPSVTSWWIMSRDVGKKCSGCNEAFEVMVDRQVELQKAS